MSHTQETEPRPMWEAGPLHGRDAESAALDRLVAEAREGRSGALVLRGEPGMGKSALLDQLASVPDARVLRVGGVEAETSLACAGLLQLLWPLQDRIDTLPEPQAEVLRAVVLGGSRVADRYTTGLAVLTLLADLAEDRRPLLCLVDDAQWLDQVTADALLFAARRIAAEGVVMVFAARDEGFDAHGLPEWRLPRLDRDASARLLAGYGLAPGRRNAVIDEADGNPLALLVFGHARRHPVGNGAPHLSIADRVLAAFRARIAALPERTRLMTLIIAAEGRSDSPGLLTAAGSLGVGLEDLQPAEQAGLVAVDGTAIAFRHPLIRTAAYQSGVLAQRVLAHRALAEASSDPDCRARHGAAAATGPDAAVAEELEQAAERARTRAAPAIAAGLYRQAADLTPDPSGRARRLGAAATTALESGDVDEAGDLVSRAERLTGDPAARAWLAPVRAAVEFERGDPVTAARILIEHAPDAPPDTAEGMARTAATYAWFSGDAASVREAAALLPLDPAVQGMAFVVDGDHGRGVPLLVEAASRAGGGMAGVYAAAFVGDDETMLSLVTAEAERCRREGLIGALPEVLQMLARSQVLEGRHRDAEASVAEAEAIAWDIGLRRRVGRLELVLARIAAVEGDADRCFGLAEPTVDSGVSASCVLSLLDLGMGRHERALDRLEAAWAGPGRHMTALLASTGDQVEAAVRLGVPERAAEPLRLFRSWAEAVGQPWARAIASRCEGMLTGEEQSYADALALHGQSGRPFERARTELVYGEWLRRAKRRTEARAHLRAALEVFDRLRAAPWVERVRGELGANGDAPASAPSVSTRGSELLTPQELQVVRLAAEGFSSRDIAARLFLSRRTVEHHLYKAYPKLGVRSRGELVRLDLGTLRVAGGTSV
ncbi:AAA family ATPase [Actinocorallia sp. B10E7]|uniref:AAA family ATPase n=1 Tax=Actinocorallia sp. B10E7 TaxID=3153558 RepID=UPI00325DF274